MTAPGTNVWGDEPQEGPALSNRRRAGIALGIALVFFPVFHVVCGRIAVAMMGPTTEGMRDLAFVVALLAYGALAVLVLVPVAVFTVGLATDLKTRRWPRLRAAAVHGAEGLILGAGVAAVAVAGGLAGWSVNLVAFAVPPALTAFTTHLISPTAMRWRGIAWAAWALATTMIVAALVFFVAVFGAS